jgi:hypothetical protein
MEYDVLLESGTVGAINDDTLDGQHPVCFLGERVTVKFHDSNGCTVEEEGVMVEVLV